MEPAPKRSRHDGEAHEHPHHRHCHHHQHGYHSSHGHGDERRYRSHRDDDRGYHRHHAHHSRQGESDTHANEQPKLQRDDWMTTGPGDERGSDFFSSLGSQKPAPEPRPKPPIASGASTATELGRASPARAEPSAPPTLQPAQRFGALGYQWRMTKLNRVYQMAEEAGVDVEQVALERYGSMDAFNEARAERQFLEDRDAGRSPSRSYSRASDRSNSQAQRFRRPGESPVPRRQPEAPMRQSEAPSRSAKPSRATIPSVLPATGPMPWISAAGSRPALTTSELNKLEAKVLRAELSGRPEAASLRRELEAEKQRATTGGDRQEQVEALPVVNAHGQLYDIGTSSSQDVEAQEELLKHGSRRELAKHKKELQREEDNRDVSLSDLVREERMIAGHESQKNSDVILANQISSDQGFQDDADYVDEEAQRFARKKMKDDAMKRQFAIQDFARTKRALDSCPFCWQDDGRLPPRAHIVSSGSCVYLAIPDREPLTDLHCWIVPMQHHLSSLDVDEDGWTEIRNFMKCLIRMAAAQGCSMIFFETVLSLKAQKHTYLEAVPIPNDIFDEIPAYFKTALMEVESEWSDHAQIISFSERRPFQNSMVSKLPYFMVQWDYKGQRGYGHVIESQSDTHGRALPGSQSPTYDEDHLGGAGFPRWFAQEILGNLLDLEPARWRNPKHRTKVRSQLDAFHRAWDPYDWTQQV